MIFTNKGSSYEEMAKQKSRNNFLIKILRYSIGILFTIPYYFSTLLVSIIYRIIYAKEYNYKKDVDFCRYLNGLPNHNIGHKIRKVEEGFFFKKYENDICSDDSLDVGIEDGIVSSLHLPNNRFTYGNEMLVYNMEKAKSYNRWDNYTTDDLQNAVSYTNGSVNDVVMIHVYDHIQDVNKFFKEINRIQKIDGKLFFSGLSDFHIKSSISYKIKSIFGMTDFEKHSKVLNSTINQYNFINKIDLEEILKKYGYVLKEFYYLNGGTKFDSYFFDFFYYWLYKYKAEPLVRRLAGINLFRKLNDWIFISIEYPKYKSLKKSRSEEGRDFFCYAVKKNNI